MQFGFQFVGLKSEALENIKPVIAKEKAKVARNNADHKVALYQHDGITPMTEVKIDEKTKKPSLVHVHKSVPIIDNYSSQLLDDALACFEEQISHVADDETISVNFSFSVSRPTPTE